MSFQDIGADGRRRNSGAMSGSMGSAGSSGSGPRAILNRPPDRRMTLGSESPRMMARSPRTLSRSPSATGPAFEAQRALGLFEKRALEVAEAVEILGTDEDTQEHRQQMQENVDMAMDAANRTRNALEVHHAFLKSAPSGNQRMGQMIHSKLVKDFEKEFERLNKNVQVALKIQRKQSAVVESESASSWGNRAGSSLDNDPTQALLQQEAVEYNMEELEERDRAFGTLQNSVNQLNEIYSEVAVLVERQGEDVHDLEANVEATAEQTSAGLAELLKSKLYRRKCNRCTCMVLLTLLLLIAVIIVFTISK